MISRLFMRLWPHTTSASPNRKILRAALIVGFFTLLAKGGAAIKELIIARMFGRNDSLDAFLIAYLLPSFALGLVMGAFGAVLIPALVETRQKCGSEAAHKLFSSMILLTVLALGAIAVLLGLLAPYYLPYLGSGFSAAKLGLTRDLLYVLLPFVLFSGFAGCASAALNSLENFALPALAPLLTTLATVLWIGFGPRNWGPFLLAGGVVAGSVLEAALLARALRTCGMHLRWQWSGLTPDVRSALRQYAPMLAGAFLMSSTGVVDQSMAAMLPAGSVAALNYAGKIVGGIVTVGATALGTAAFPYLAKMAAETDWDGCRHTLKRYSVLVFSTTVPFTLCLIAFSRPLVRLLFQRGAFTSADTQMVSWTQIAYLFQVPFYIWTSLFVRFLSSIRRNDVLLYASGICLPLDIALNLVLMRRWGVVGLAMSTSVVYAFTLLFVTAWSFRLLRQRRLRTGAASEDEALAPTETLG